MKKSKERNNKGFSLVELIVVILIIGILGVSLAPQVTKWVGNAKVNSDVNNKAGIESAVQTVYVEYVARHYEPNFPITITVADTGTTVVGENAPAGVTTNKTGTFDTDFKALLDDVLNKPVSPGNGDTNFEVEIDVDGVVTVTGGYDESDLK